jgi:hypothetical protein
MTTTIDTRRVALRGGTVVLTRAIRAQPPAGAGEDDVLAAIRYVLTWRGFKNAAVSPGRVDFGPRRLFSSFGLDANPTSFISGGTVHVADGGRDVRLELRISTLMALAVLACVVWVVMAPFDAAARVAALAVLAIGSVWTGAIALSFVGGWIEGAVRDPARHRPNRFG